MNNQYNLPLKSIPLLGGWRKRSRWWRKQTWREVYGCRSWACNGDLEESPVYIVLWFKVTTFYRVGNGRTRCSAAQSSDAILAKITSLWINIFWRKRSRWCRKQTWREVYGCRSWACNGDLEESPVYIVLWFKVTTFYRVGNGRTRCSAAQSSDAILAKITSLWINIFVNLRNT